MQCTARTNFLHKKIPYLHALQGNGEMGARYLDPKYSRWISVDPALGEYIPAAGKGNAGNLPGMGGIYNHINGNLYHYAGNNPVRYMDPDGRKFDTSEISKSEECLKRFNIAISELKKTERGAFIIKQLEESKIVFTITHNNNNKNKYNPENKTIEWDSNRILVKEFHFDSEQKKWIYDEYVDAITLLGHELGHAYQDLTGLLPDSATQQQQELLDDKNIEENENPIAKERGYYERKNHREFLHQLRFTAKEFLE